MLEEHLKQLALELALPTIPTKDGNNFFPIPLEGDITLLIKEMPLGSFLTASITLLPDDAKKEELFAHLLKANFLGQGTGQQYLGLDLEEKFLTLSRSIPQDRSYQAFKEALEAFANYFEYWREELQRIFKQPKEQL